MAVMLLTEKESKGICERLLGHAKADDAVVSVSSEDYAQLRCAANGFATSGRRENAMASVTVWIGEKRGSAGANALDHASLKRAVAEAERLARLAPIDHEYLPTLGPQSYKPTGWYVDATANIALAAGAEAMDEIIRACEKEGVIGAGFHHASGTAAGSATKHGNFHYRRSSLVGLSVTARTTDGGSSGYFLRNHFDVAKLDTARISRASIQKTHTSTHPRALETG